MSADYITIRLDGLLPARAHPADPFAEELKRITEMRAWKGYRAEMLKKVSNDPSLREAFHIQWHIAGAFIREQIGDD